MTEINQNRYDQLLRRVADLKGHGSKINDALTELFPMFDVENTPMELMFLNRNVPVMASSLLAGVSAEIPKIQVFNPADSGTLVTITSVWISVEVDSFIEMDLTDTALSTPVATKVRDTRAGHQALALGELRVESSAGGIPTSWGAEVLALSPIHIEDQNGVAVLAPGTGLTVDTVETNRSLRASFFWRERAAEPSELNL